MAGLTIGFKSRKGSEGDGRIIGSIVLLIFAAVGAVVSVFLVRWMLREEASRHWDLVQCRMDVCTFELPRGDRDEYRLRVRYRYTVGGREYTSERYSSQDPDYDDFEKIQRAMLKFPQGMDAYCCVDPQDPSQAFLTHTSRWLWLILPFPLLFFVIGTGGMWALWRYRPSQSLSIAAELKKNQGGGWILALVMFIFFAVGTGLNLFLFLPAALRWMDAKSWPEAQATVVHSRVRVSSGEDSDTYAVDVLYRYSQNGQQYLSNRYGFFGGSSSGRAAKQQIVSRLRPGTQLTVYVNPDDPVIAVINRELGWWMLFALIPSVFMLIGGGVLLGMFLEWRNPKAARESKGKTQAALFPAASDDPPLRYSSGKARRVKAIAIGIFALFWNGISWTIAIVMWRDNAGIVPLLFISIFLLIGLGTMGAFLHSLLAMFNPTLELEFSHAPIRLGDTVTAKWSFQGRFDRIGTLTILLQGREEATYRQGTSTHTDKKIFRTLDLVETAKQVDIARGQVRFVIPADTMHSFEASNNKIVWEMIVKGEISNWPDVKEEIVIRILPLEGGTT